MSIWQEFKEFAIKGNAIDLAVGVVIGAAFGKIINALVANVIMPFIGLFSGGVNFTSLKLTLANPAAVAGLGSAQPATLEYGLFIQAVVDFLVVALALFAMIKLLNNLKRKEPAIVTEPAPPSAEEVLLAEIRDLLKQRTV